MQTERGGAALLRGRGYCRRLRRKKPRAVEEQLRQIEHQHVLAEREQRIQELIDNQNGVWKYFENYVILGDSRAVGFSYFGFLDESRVLAESGATILQVSEKLDELAELEALDGVPLLRPERHRHREMGSAVGLRRGLCEDDREPAPHAAEGKRSSSARFCPRASLPSRRRSAGAGSPSSARRSRNTARKTA